MFVQRRNDMLPVGNEGASKDISNSLRGYVLALLYSAVEGYYEGTSLCKEVVRSVLDVWERDGGVDETDGLACDFLDGFWKIG